MGRAIRALSNYFVYQAKLYGVPSLSHPRPVCLPVVWWCSMVGPEAPKSIYDDGDGDDDDDGVADRASFLQPKRPAAPLDVPGTVPFSAVPLCSLCSLLSREMQQTHPSGWVVVADAVVAPKKRLTAADRRKNAVRTQQQLATKRKSFMDGFNSFAVKQRETMQQMSSEDEELAEKKETGGVL
jgi:hypothetical protein